MKKKDKKIDEKIISRVKKTLRKKGIKKAGIFGSFARGEETKKSDVDILIKPKKNTGLFEFVGIKLELEELLKRKVDLLTYKSLHPYLKKIILSEEVRII